MKNLKKITIPTVLVIFTLLIIACSLSTVSAVNQTISDSTAGGIAQGITDTEINGTLTLNSGTYNKTNQDTNITISKNITIKGNGQANQVIIDAQGLSRIFRIANNTNINFVNITFLNANYTNNGGAIFSSYAETIMTFINCTFINNTATSGGAIYSGGELVVMNSNFVDNSANGNGGAIRVISIMKIINSVFINNTATYGGAIHDISISGFIFDCNFENNYATKTGGAICGGNNLLVDNSTFYDNSANQYGGSIYTDSPNLTVINSIFEKNHANDNGGAIAIAANGKNSSIKNSIFINNFAKGFGGAISQTAENVNMSLNSFINNFAGNGGGAISIHSTKPQGNIIANNSFIANYANNSGGAIRSNGNNVIISNNNFTANYANINGGGICNYDTLTVFNNIMEGNTVGGLGNAIYNNGIIGILNLTYISNSTITTNKGSNIVLYVTLTDDRGNTVTGQNISFYVNGIYVGSVESIEGKANLTYTTTNLGIFPVNGTYDGAGNSINTKNGQLKVEKITTKSTIVANNLRVGKETTISGVASDENGNSLANTQISVTIDGKTYSVTTNSIGQWSLTYTPKSTGNLKVIVSWAGNDTHHGFTNTKSFKISKIKTILEVEVVGDEIIATLTDEDGNPIVGKKLLLKNSNGRVLGVGFTNENGQVIFKYTGNSIYLTVSFAGDDAYSGVDVKFRFNEDIDVNNDKTSNNSAATSAAMKDTGIPIIAVLIVLLSTLGICIAKKQK